MFEESSDVVGQGQQAAEKETDERGGSDGQEEKRSDGEKRSDEEKSGQKRGQPDESDEDFEFNTAAPSRYVKKLKAMGRKPSFSETSSSEDDKAFFEPLAVLKPAMRKSLAAKVTRGRGRGRGDRRGGGAGAGRGEVGQAVLE